MFKSIESFLRLRKRLWEEKAAIEAWKAKGSPMPPPHEMKECAVREYAKQFSCRILVETGTYLGDMVEAQRGRFREIISVELGKELYENARKRFLADKSVRILHGDSGRVLNEVVPGLKGRALFWLDGHYSAGITAKGEKECPIFEELEAIFKDNPRHVVLIDDARCFTGSGGFPALSEVMAFIREKGRGYQVAVRDDIIRVEPA